MTVSTLERPGRDPAPTSTDAATHTMHVCDPIKHTVVTWTPGAESERVAATVFASRKGWGYLAYATWAPGEHETLTEFNASAPLITLSRPVQGG